MFEVDSNLSGEDSFVMIWKEHQQSEAFAAFRQMRAFGAYCDITIVCYGGKFLAHKIILAASSPYFNRRLTGNRCTTIDLPWVKSDTMSTVIELIYAGKVTIMSDGFTAFMQAMVRLEIRALRGNEIPGGLPTRPAEEAEQGPSTSSAAASTLPAQAAITAPMSQQDSASASSTTSSNNRRTPIRRRIPKEEPEPESKNREGLAVQDGQASAGPSSSEPKTRRAHASTDQGSSHQKDVKAMGIMGRAKLPARRLRNTAVDIIPLPKTPTMGSVEHRLGRMQQAAAADVQSSLIPRQPAIDEPSSIRGPAGYQADDRVPYHFLASALQDRGYRQDGAAADALSIPGALNQQEFDELNQGQGAVPAEYPTSSGNGRRMLTIPGQTLAADQVH